MWISAQCYVASWMGKEFGAEGIYVYVWLSPFTIHRKQHCQSALCVYVCVRVHACMLSHFYSNTKLKVKKKIKMLTDIKI